jgi:hypothetical protein
MGLTARVIDQDIDFSVAKASQQASHEQGLGSHDVRWICRVDLDEQVDITATRCIVGARAE